MRRFICKLMILVCIVGSIVEGVNYIYKKNHFSSQKVPKDLQIVNVGSSHAFYGLYYEELEGVTGFNLALTGQVPSYDLRMLKMYKDNLEEDGLCLIPVSWFSFVWNEQDAEGFDAKNSRYYTILNWKYIKEYSLENDIRWNLFPALYDKQNIFKKDADYGLALASRGENWYNSAEDMDVEDNAKKSYQGQVIDWSNIILEEEVEAIYDMIEICRAKEVTPVLITFPFTSEFNDCADESVDIVFCNIMEEVVKNTGVEWYDYSNDERFINNKGLFMDSNHLNYDGAKKFTHIIKEEIIEIHL